MGWPADRVRCAISNRAGLGSASMSRTKILCWRAAQGSSRCSAQIPSALPSRSANWSGTTPRCMRDTSGNCNDSSRSEIRLLIAEAAIRSRSAAHDAVFFDYRQKEFQREQIKPCDHFDPWLAASVGHRQTSTLRDPGKRAHPLARFGHDHRYLTLPLHLRSRNIAFRQSALRNAIRSLFSRSVRPIPKRAS
jgi:hypothetical protein